MIRTIIVDDEPNCCEVLQIMIGKFCPDLVVLAACHSGSDALIAIEKYNPQVLFLDVEMPYMNGFELLEKLPNVNFELIFTTSYNQYAIRAIRINALDYLLKPIDREELILAVTKVSQRLNKPSVHQLRNLFKSDNAMKPLLKRIALPTVDGLQMEEIDAIISCSSEGNYTHFTLKKNKKIIVSRTMKDVEDLLADYSFVRVHNSFLVNLNEIQKYVKGDGGYLLMSDGNKIEVSRSRKENLLQHLRPNWL
ncbi:MAG TPA: LytTR family DNA-binding domain-containing protein [Puia sp.]|nr:LytTR family DNA-binding domain-containing protein [Puia sp.]